MDKVIIDIAKTLVEHSPTWMKGLGAIAVSKGIIGIYQLQYNKIKTLTKENEELKRKLVKHGILE